MGKSTFEERKKKPAPASSKPAPKAPAPVRDSGKESKPTHDIGKVGMTSGTPSGAKPEPQFEGALGRIMAGGSKEADDAALERILAAGKEDPEDVIDRVLAAGNEKEDKQVLERIMRGPKMDMDAYIKRIQEENFQASMRGERTEADRAIRGDYDEENRKAMDRVMSGYDPNESKATIDRIIAQNDPKENARVMDIVMQGLDYPRILSLKEKSALQKMIADGVVSLTPEHKITGDEYEDSAAIAEYFLSQKGAENALSTTEEAHPLSHDPLFGLSSERTRNSPIFESYRTGTVLPQYKRFYKKIHPPKEPKAK